MTDVRMLAAIVAACMLVALTAIGYGAYRSYANDAQWCRAYGGHYDWWATSCAPGSGSDTSDLHR